MKYFAGFEELAPREGQPGEREVLALRVARREAPGREVAQEPRPGLLGVAGDHRVGVRLGLVRHERRVRPAEHHLRPAGAEPVGDGVAAERGAGDERDAHEVGVDPVRVDVLDPLVEELDLGVQLRRDVGGERRERERPVAERAAEDAAAVPVERALRRDERDAHGTSSGRMPRAGPGVTSW
ncbi:MAG: hypothetical protein QM704_24975 [Anaeromyxobacteraceae bacterium]